MQSFDPLAEERISTAPLPTRRTLMMRSFIPYQLYRFVRINLRMMQMAFKAH